MSVAVYVSNTKMVMELLGTEEQASLFVLCADDLDVLTEMRNPHIFTPFTIALPRII